ncbi:hypothetical protein MC7420_3845 [Coleofasciculus chthonoplastes PCC 7420]|uniref:Uncharacterized protein n=1 Tax=Coleofasciculus chthonoplastes PCC 7420 TaxID=118168 RepID=B4VUP3_9CYAN|nr:hypothetical protein MC7420_3845 [Coleofasciculus chthonoplastes PCC 7420]
MLILSLLLPLISCARTEMEGQGDQLTTASEIMSPLKCEYERVKVELMDIKSS